MISVIDNKYVFPVHKNIRHEIEKRSKINDKSKKGLKKNRTTTSLIGYGPVCATVTKELSRTIMQSYEDCLNEIGPFIKEEEEEEESSCDDTLFSGFFKEEKSPPTQRKRKHGLLQEASFKKEVYKDTVKKLKNIDIPVKVCKVNDKIESYYEQMKLDILFGCVGQIPDPFKKQGYVLPDTLSEFVKTPFGQILVDFCEKELK